MSWVPPAIIDFAYLLTVHTTLKYFTMTTYLQSQK